MDDLNLDGMSGEERLALAGEILASIDLSETWDKTRPVEFEVDLDYARLELDIDLAEEVHAKAEALGREPEELVHEWIRAGLRGA